jgi:hypothetical protein
MLRASKTGGTTSPLAIYGFETRRYRFADLTLRKPGRAFKPPDRIRKAQSMAARMRKDRQLQSHRERAANHEQERAAAKAQGRIPCSGVKIAKLGRTAEAM